MLALRYSDDRAIAQLGTAETKNARRNPYPQVRAALQGDPKWQNFVSRGPAWVPGYTHCLVQGIFCTRNLFCSLFPDGSRLEPATWVS